jgi:putative flippase GtrA
VTFAFTFGTRTRYLFVGGTCAALHNAIVIGFDRVAVGYVVASAVSFVVVDLVGYLMHTALTYKAPRSVATLARYTVAMAANYPLIVALLFVMVTLAGVPVFIAAPAGTVILFGWNFLASRWAIVRNRVRAD